MPPVWQGGASLVAQTVPESESTCNAGDLGSISGLGRSPGEGNSNSLQCSSWKSHGRVQYAQRQIRENYIYNFHCAEMNYQTKAEDEFSRKFAPFINDNNVERMMNELAKAEQQIHQNGNAKIIFFDLCLQMIVMVK